MKQRRMSNIKPSWREKLETLSLPQFLPALKGIRRGLEKEALRVTADARIAHTGHPTQLGSALTHDHITTDYAEALMEFITPVGTDAERTLEFLADIQQHAYRLLGEEYLWPVSMPCYIDNEDDIELAQYGDSNIGKMKTIYRQGLKNRYGSMMQTIAGVHYNFSMPDSFWPLWQKIKGDRQPLQDFISESYLGLTRNFLRIGWMIPYLFGASPAVDSSFLKNSRNRMQLENFGQETQYLPHATSLRMSELGYSSTEQDHLEISYNRLSEFVSGLRRATNQQNKMFESIGVKRQGEYQQLNSNTLQNESELYAPIRPKRTVKFSEKLSDALQGRGIEYIEVRSLDINPYSETGIDLEQMHFLDVFLVYCLLNDSPSLSQQQQYTAKQNLNKVAVCGRDYSLLLIDGQQSKTLNSWAEEIFTDLNKVAQLLDHAYHEGNFKAVVSNEYQKFGSPELTPSARMLKTIQEQELEISAFALSLAKMHRRKLFKNGYRQIPVTKFTHDSARSWQMQKELETADTLGFDDFLHLTLEGTFSSPPALEKAERDYCFWSRHQNQSLGCCAR